MCSMGNRIPLERLAALVGRSIAVRPADGGDPLPAWVLVEAAPVPERSRAPQAGGDCYILLFRVEAPLPQGTYRLRLPGGLGELDAFATPVAAALPGAHMEAVFN